MATEENPPDGNDPASKPAAKEPQFDGDFDEDRAKKAITNLRQENATQKAALAEAQAKAAKLDELEDASKSELQRANEEAAAAKEQAATSSAALLRYEVAMDKGLTQAQAKRLTGTTKEELEADADELVEMFGQKNPAPPGGGVKDSLRPAGAGNELPEETDPAKLAALHPRR